MYVCMYVCLYICMCFTLVPFAGLEIALQSHEHTHLPALHFIFTSCEEVDQMDGLQHNQTICMRRKFSESSLDFVCFSLCNSRED